MGTRSKTTVFDERNKPILSFYRQLDGYFEGHGEDLAKFLENRKIVNGYGLKDSEAAKVSNGMSCLAASLIAHFKKDIGGIYITSHDDDQEYNYDIRYVELPNQPDFGGFARISLVGKGYDETMKFKLYEDEAESVGDDVTYNEIVEFTYEKPDGSESLRKIGVFEKDGEYITGLDLNDGNKYKAFRKGNIRSVVKVLWKNTGKTKGSSVNNYHNVRGADGRFVKG
jgi:hypothetical protein